MCRLHITRLLTLTVNKPFQILGASNGCHMHSQFPEEGKSVGGLVPTSSVDPGNTNPLLRGRSESRLYPLPSPSKDHQLPPAGESERHATGSAID